MSKSIYSRKVRRIHKKNKSNTTHTIKEINAFQQLYNDKLMLILLASILILFGGLLAFNYANKKPITLPLLLEYVGLSFVLFGTLWMGMGAYLPKDRLDYFKNLEKTDAILDEVVNMLVESSTWCRQGAYLVFAGSVIGMGAFIYHGYEASIKNKENNHQVGCEKIEHHLVNKDASSEVSTIFLKCKGIEVTDH